MTGSKPINSLLTCQKHDSCYLPKLSMLELNCILIIQKSKRKSTKFLRIIIDNQLTWKEHIKYCKSKLACSLYAMNSSEKVLKFKSPNDVILYDIISLPLIWSSTVGSSFKIYCKEIEVMQKNTHWDY